jgi:hypothetical protein
MEEGKHEKERGGHYSLKALGLEESEGTPRCLLVFTPRKKP